MRKYLIMAVLPLMAACNRSPDTIPEMPPGQALSLSGARLEDALERLDRDLVRALRGGLDGDAVETFVRAESMTDRLLETRYPYEWLRADNYSVQAKLRQIQALADRIGAELRTAAPRDSAMADLRRLRAEVLTLRRALAQGGGQQPIPLERLLAGRDTLGLLGIEEGVVGD